MQKDVNAFNMLSEAKFYESYARWNDDEGRYETWDEAVTRVMNMHRDYYKDRMTPELNRYVDEAESMYKLKRVLGAQRALQYGGEQLLKHQIRLYNCVSTHADRSEVFGELFYFLLGGCGAGFSVQKHHVETLPNIQPRKGSIRQHIVEDSIEGWATAINVLMSSFFVGGVHPEFEGKKIYFDLSKIRPKGAMISGGFKAPGPEPLRRALDKVEHLIQGLVLKGKDRLRPIDVYDIVMHTSDAVLAGGVRRCLPEYYEVKMFDGSYKKISEIQAGDLISYNGEGFVVNELFDNGKQDLVKIECGNGKYHVSTGTHKWLVLNKTKNELEWVAANDIAKNPTNFGFVVESGVSENLNKQIQTTSQQTNYFPSNYDIVDIVSAESYKEEHTYDIEVDTVHAFTARNPHSDFESVSHNSATICLFSHDDHEMANAKTGNWYEENPQRARSNNSAVIVRDEISREEFRGLMKSIREFGEPGFYFVENKDHTTNPCVEIGMYPVFEGESGFQGCNLTEINGRYCTTKEEFFKYCRASAIIGTLQAGYTDFKFVSETTKKIFEREALLGVSITGWMNNPDVLLDEEILKEGAKIVVETNEKVAAALGINPAARTTCVKPAGTSCTTFDTKIKTENGIMNLKEIFDHCSNNTIDVDKDNIGDDTTFEVAKNLRVYDEHNTLRDITGLYVNGMARIYEIEFEDGNVYKFTDHHKLKTANGWKEVKDLTEDDIIESF